MKVFLFHSEFSFKSTLKFIVWYVFFAFFGDVFSDRDMVMTLTKCNCFIFNYSFTNPSNNIEIRRVREKAVFPSSLFNKISKDFLILFSLLITKKANIYTDEIILKMSRIELLFGIVKALLLLPLRFFQAQKALLDWKKERKKVIYPITLKNIKKAIKIYEKLIKEGKT